MPFADPQSDYLTALARQKALDDTLRAQGLQASQGVVGALQGAQTQANEDKSLALRADQQKRLDERETRLEGLGLGGGGAGGGRLRLASGGPTGIGPAGRLSLTAPADDDQLQVNPDDTPMPVTVDEAEHAQLRQPMSDLPLHSAGFVSDEVHDIQQGMHPHDDSTTDHTDQMADAFAGVDPHAVTPPVALTDKERKAKADADAAESRAKLLEKKASGSPAGAAGAGAGGALTDKQRKAKADADLAEKKVEAFGKPPPGKAKGGDDGKAINDQIAAANQLAAIYDKNKLDRAGGLLTKPGSPFEGFADDDRQQARTLVTVLSLGIPGTFSHSKRLNAIEFKEAMHAIGDPDSTLSNEQKAKKARFVAQELKAALSEAPAPSGSDITARGTATPAAADVAIPTPSAGW